MTTKSRLDRIENKLDTAAVLERPDPRFTDDEAKRMEALMRKLTDDELQTVIHAGSGAKLTEPEAALYNRIMNEVFNAV